MSARLIAVSGLGPKEPAAFVVEADGRRLLLDCGEGPEPGRMPDFEAIGKVDAVILSHSHNDHAAALRFVERIGNPPVYATAPVLARLRDKVTAHAIPISGRTDVLGIEVCTGANGHAPGGIWMRLAVGGGLLYMGDYSLESRLYAFDLPPAANTMIIDTSYGEFEQPLDRGRAALKEIAGAGPVLLPVPADGRGPDIAIYLQGEGFDVAIDNAVRSVATMLMQSARESARPDIVPALDRLVSSSRSLDKNSSPHGVMVAHGGSGDAGVAGELIKRWERASSPVIMFTGHLAAGTTGRRIVDSGRAEFQRWNVHPLSSENIALVESVRPKRVLPAFGDTKFYPFWREKLAPREAVTATPLAL